jgi:hypothetical protein
MPAISFFADGRDVNLLVDRLNTDPEIAFIVPDGPLDPEVALAKRLRAALGERPEGAYTFYLPFGSDDGYRQCWKAVRTVEGLKDGHHSLWHVPAGALPLLGESGPDEPIPDPWAGWTERRPGADTTTPYFGPEHPAEVRLDLWTRHRPYSDEERASLPRLNGYWDGEQDLLVVSDFQWVGGRSSPQQTRRWWRRLRTWLGQTATRIDAEGPQTFWAFPSALRKLKAGTAYYARGWQLSKLIQAASLEVSCLRARDLFPARPVALDPAWLRWRDGTVARLAQATYDGRRRPDGTLEPERLAVLADALEEAGCADQDILGHLREQGAVHVRGCWVIDCLTGRR